MENENSKKKTTASDTSVGADDGQPLHNSTENSISAFEGEINGDFQNSTESLDEIYRRMQRLTDPHYLHTISMTELYQTAYQSRPPIIDGLLYAGAYILAGAPKIGKSFLVAQIAYHVSTGKALWDYEVHPGTVLYLALEDDFHPSGLGKTHLMFAIINEVKRKNPKCNIIYITGEQFTNELIDALAAKKNEENVAFRDKYRNCDMLLVDDIQFIAGKAIIVK